MKTSQVRHLIKFMLLEDVAKVRHKVRTRGRETQRHVNFRSAGELEMGYGRKALAEKKADMSRRFRKASRAAIAFSSSQLALLDAGPRQTDYSTGAKADLLSVAAQVLLASFDREMVALLEPYCSLTAAQHWVPFDAPGCDCGTLARGRRYSVRIRVLNASQDTLSVVGVATRGDAAPAVRAIFDPNPFVPGLTRVVELLVAPLSRQGGEFAGAVDVAVGAGGAAPAATVAVPLFFRVESTHVAAPPDDAANAHAVGFPVDRPRAAPGALHGRHHALHVDSSLDECGDDDGGTDAW